jgi:hypothetical protein
VDFPRETQNVIEQHIITEIFVLQQNQIRVRSVAERRLEKIVEILNEIKGVINFEQIVLQMNEQTDAEADHEINSNRQNVIPQSQIDVRRQTNREQSLKPLQNPPFMRHVQFFDVVE